MSADTPTKRLAHLADMPGVSPDFLSLAEALLDWRQSLEAEIRDRYPSARPDPDALRSALTGTRCLAELCDPLPEPALLARAAGTLTEVLRARIGPGSALCAWLSRGRLSSPGNALAATWFSAAWQGNRIALADLARSAGPGETAAPPKDPAADALAPDADVLSWAGRELCRPFFHRFGELLATESAAPLEARPTCPSCGGEPRFARLERDEGRRFLWCDLCNVQWAYRRMTCPFCGNTEQTKLGFLSIEGDEQHRIDLCDSCRGYLRAVNERGLPEGQRVDFLSEDLGTVHLCMAAEAEGYRPGDGKPGAGLQGEG